MSISRSSSRLDRAEEEEEEEADSSKGSALALEVQKKRSSSERKALDREEEALESDSPRDERRGQEGKAQVASWERRLEGVMSMGMAMALLDMELYEPYDPYIVGWLVG